MTKPLISPRWGALTITAFMTFALGACAADQASEVTATNAVSQENTVTEPLDEPSVAEQESVDPAAGEGDHVFGLERDSMVEVIEQTYESRNAKARWEGDVFIVAIDGDAREDMAGFSDCRVLTQILNEDDVVRIEYPNGNIECVDALADD